MTRWLMLALLSILAVVLYGYVFLFESLSLSVRVPSFLLLTGFFAVAFWLLYLCYFSPDNSLKRFYRNETVRTTVIALGCGCGSVLNLTHGFHVLTTGDYYLKPELGYRGEYTFSVLNNFLGEAFGPWVAASIYFLFGGVLLFSTIVLGRRLLGMALLRSR